MRIGLIILGILIIGGMFVFANIVVTPQQKTQADIASGACGSIFGQIGSAVSNDIATGCKQVQGIAQILSFEWIAYGLGGLLLILGLVIPSGKKEVHTIIKEIHTPARTSREDDEDEDNGEDNNEEEDETSKKIKARFCDNCGHKVIGRSKFCPSCGEKL